MKTTEIFIGGVVLGLGLLHAQDAEPKRINPGQAGTAPEDAIVLFDGTSLSAWVNQSGQPLPWEIVDGAMRPKKGAAAPGINHAFTKGQFGSGQIHIEFAIPSMPTVSGQARGNSGVYLQGRYEIQVLDSFENPTYPNGMCGAIYGVAAPLVNACRRPEEWQSYDVVFHAPKCSADGNYADLGSITMLWNGVLVHDNAKVVKPEGKCDDTEGPIMLQDHYHPDAEYTAMRYRNIWYRPFIGAAERGAIGRKR